MHNRLLMLALPAALMLAGCALADRLPSEPADNTVFRFDLEAIAAANSGFAELVDPSPLGGPALKLRADSAGRTLQVPGSEAAEWTGASYLVAEAWQADAHSDILYVHFFSRENAERPRITSLMGILPELRTRLVVPLALLDGQTYFMPRQPRLLKGSMPGRRLPLEAVSHITLGMAPVAEGFQPEIWISDLRLTRDLPPPLPPEAPVVDELGQWTAREWPGKTRDAEQLVGDLRDLRTSVGAETFPETWSRYGGWNEKSFGASGFFRTHHDGSRWWLVDPDGFAFFSVGVDVSTPTSAGPISGMEDLLAWLPPRNGPYAPAFSDGRNMTSFSFLTSNLIRAFGENWRTEWEAMTAGLFRRWRFNTIGNWSSTDLIASARLPYVLPLSGFPTTETLLYRDFPDVFSPEYAAAADSFARQMEARSEDPFLIGYFLRNEPLWAFGDNIVASEMLATGTASFTRRALASWLGEKYGGDAEGLSRAWGHRIESFSALESVPLLDAHALSAAAESDLREFSGIMVDEYLRLPSQALRRAAPNHMNLGIRYAWISSDLCYRGSDYFDVFSINEYRDEPSASGIAEIERRTGKPVMIGEFHHGAIDRGLPSTGIRGVASQEDRGIAYRYYIEQGATIPALVGMHFFQLNDQPVLGRFDGENYNIGLVDICNVPYPELTGAATETNSRIYEVASGQTPPFSQPARRIPNIFF
jgi:hypothetical protein